MTSGAVQSPTSPLSLTSLAGPSTVSFPLTEPGPLTIGRLPDRSLYLNDRRVSREHASLIWQPNPQSTEENPLPGQWFITDSGSRHGTWLNGRQLPPGTRWPIRGGDYLAIGPWTFSICDGAAPSTTRFMAATIDDSATAGSMVSKVDVQLAGAIERQRLTLLLDCAEEIHAARDRQTLADAVLEAAIPGTGFANAAFLGPLSDDGRIDVVASRGTIFAADSLPRLSRSLIREAARGVPARLFGSLELANHAHSIISLGIREALCVPIMLGQAPAGFLYLDNRTDSGEQTPIAPDASMFAIGLARLAAMALANLMRLEIERRNVRIEAELHAAAESQRCLMPPREGTLGRFRYAGLSRPGQYVGGDFFDVIKLGQDRLAIAIGDVTGHGMAASLLMAASKGFLHAALIDHGDPGRAVTDLNRYILPRFPDERFLTLWVGIFNETEHTLHYVDAGHGYAMLMANGGFEMLNASRETPVGVLPDTHYLGAVQALPPTGRVVLLTDGLLEQHVGQPEGKEGIPGREVFGMDGIRACLAALPPGGNEITAIFEAVEKHAGTNVLADDATAVVIRWPAPTSQ